MTRTDGGFQPSRCPRIGRSVVAREDESGAVQVKVVVTKKQLKQMVAVMGQERSAGAAGHRLAASPSLEQVLHSLRRRHMKRGEKGQYLNLSAAHLYPADAHFEAGNKGTFSFSWVDDARLQFAKEDRIKPFFETPNYWGIQRKRTRLLCDTCGHLLGHVYDDGPPMMRGHGQLGFAHSHTIPRAPRYRFKIKALNISYC
ncbi:hypothetical protein BHE74_00042044 [Ensete ventricosum]|nr:hypothetical protein BHE74_00042044 [Ensete ventricosum]